MFAGWIPFLSPDQQWWKQYEVQQLKHYYKASSWNGVIFVFLPGRRQLPERRL